MVTWIGGNNTESPNANVRVDRFGYPYITAVTASTDMPTTPGAYHSSYQGGTNDIYVAKLDSDGSRILHATYLGGNGNDVFETHPAEVGRSGNDFVLFGTSSSNIQTTDGAYSSGRQGNTDAVLVKFSPDFTVTALSIIGGNAGDSFDGIGIDAKGCILITGESGSTDFPVTPNAYQSILSVGNGNDAVVMVLDNNLSQIQYATYLGGNDEDLFRSCRMDSMGNLYCAGASVSSNFPTLNAVQSAYGGSNDPRWGNGDAILVKFTNTDLYGSDDSDHDFLPDSWEKTHFGNLIQDGTGDADSDGNSNRLECLQGTDPNDRESLFRAWIEPFDKIVFQSESSEVDYEIRWTHDLTQPVKLRNRIDLFPSNSGDISNYSLPALDGAPSSLNSGQSLFFSVAVKPIP